MKLSANQNGRQTLIARLTVEQVLFGLLVLLAAVFRLTGLDRIPLSPAEALEALTVYQFWQPNSAVIVSGSPAYFSLTSLLSQVMGFSDPVMRLVPALFGIALPFLPWFLRHRLGSVGALITGALIVLSPNLNLLSRTGGGQSIALFSGFFLFISWVRYQETENPRWLIALTVSLALGLTSSSIFYSILITMLLGWLAIYLAGPPLFLDDEGEPMPIIRPAPETLRRALMIGGAVFIILATFFLWNLSGLNGVARNLGEWIGLFLGSSDLNTWLGPVLAIGRYEFILVLLGGPAVVWSVWHGRPFPSLLVYWLTSALLLLLIQRGNMENVAVLTIPGYLLIGRFMGDMNRSQATLYRWALSGAVLLIGVLIYFNLVRYGRLAFNAGSLTAPYQHILMFAAGLLLAAVAFAVVWSRSQNDAVPGTLFGLLAITLFFTWGTTWNLTHLQMNDTRERIITSASDDELPLMLETIREISRQTRNGDNNLEILMTIDSPALEWYLRDFDNLTVDGALPRSISSEGLITTMESIPALETGYIGADFGYNRPNTEHILSLPAALQWWFFHHSSVKINEDRAIFWLRADLAGENFQGE